MCLCSLFSVSKKGKKCECCEEYTGVCGYTHDLKVQTASDGRDTHDNEHSHKINEKNKTKQPNIIDFNK